MNYFISNHQVVHQLVLLLLLLFPQCSNSQDATEKDLVNQVYGARYPWNHPYKYGDLFKPTPIEHIQPSLESLLEMQTPVETPNVMRIPLPISSRQIQEISDILTSNFNRCPRNILRGKNAAADGLLWIDSGLVIKSKLVNPCTNEQANPIINMVIRNLRLEKDFTAQLAWKLELRNGHALFAISPCSKEQSNELEESSINTYRPALPPTDTRDHFIDTKQLPHKKLKNWRF